MAEGRGLELNSLGGEPRNPSGSCGEAKLGASPQVFDGTRRTRDWPRWPALHPEGKSLLLNQCYCAVIRQQASGQPKCLEAPVPIAWDASRRELRLPP